MVDWQVGSWKASDTTDVETIYTILMEFVGAFWCATVISSWNYLFSTKNTNSQNHDIFVYDVKQYFKGIEAPSELRDRVIAYLFGLKRKVWRERYYLDHFRNIFRIVCARRSKLFVCWNSIAVRNKVSAFSIHSRMRWTTWVIRLWIGSSRVLFKGKCLSLLKVSWRW